MRIGKVVRLAAEDLRSQPSPGATSQNIRRNSCITFGRDRKCTFEVGDRYARYVKQQLVAIPTGSANEARCMCRNCL